MALQVQWDSARCIHSGNCVKGAPQVFKVEGGKFVIDPAAASDDLGAEDGRLLSVRRAEG